jgi:hypothetical protein
MRRVSRSRSLAQVAIALVMYKLKRGGVGRRGAQCAVACRAAFFLVVGCCRGSAFACKAAEAKPETALGPSVAAWGCLHFTNSQTLKCGKRYTMPGNRGLQHVLHSLIIYVILLRFHCSHDQWITCVIQECVVLTFLSLLTSHSTISEELLRLSWCFHYILSKAYQEAAVHNVVGFTCCCPGWLCSLPELYHPTLLRVGIQGTSFNEFAGLSIELRCTYDLSFFKNLSDLLKALSVRYLSTLSRFSFVVPLKET